jgi:glucose-6-phosphate isomerase
MWDWIGGRTSVLSAVGLFPAALQGINITNLLLGACECDKVTRITNTKRNPASLISLAWYASGNGKGTKSMVVLPYKDRLGLFSKYLQQLVMESLGKEHDLDGKVVNQGIVVFGNKGATDQHSYVQQLRDGLNNFFATFVEVLKDGGVQTLKVDPKVSSGDYLHGFYLGTRQALAENGRESATITVKEVSPSTVGILIALFERAVGFYASLININAYHQPGVEAGKTAAGKVIQTQSKILEFLSKQPGKAYTVEEIAAGIIADEESEHIFKICEHLSCNHEIEIHKSFDKNILNRKYFVKRS